MLAATLATLAWVVLTMATRPLDGVEGDVLFEASRLRAGLPLYVDPASGARDYGPVPARYFVLYPPLWPALLALLPPSFALARAVATASWLGLLAWIVARAPRVRRTAAATAALLASGSFVLALYGASARPDALAVLASGIAVERAARRGSVDALAGALFAVAAFVKPNVLGAAPGALVVALMLSRRAALPGVLGAAGAAAVLGAGLSALAGEAWLGHLLASTVQPPSLARWFEQMASRAPFFAAPIALALACGWRARRDPGVAIATGALLTSSAWAVLSFAKIGSASNYMMEPMACVVVVFARASLPVMGGRAQTALALGILAQSAHNGVASVRSALEEVTLARERQRAVAEARALCGSGARDVVIADEPGLELMLDGRIVQTPFQSTHLARAGRFPIAAWIEDVSRPEVTCLLMQDDLLQRPLEDVRVEHDRFGPELRRVLSGRFVLAGERGGLRTYRLRSGPGEVLKGGDSR